MNSNYQNLNVWKKAIETVTLVYQLTKEFPREELYGLTSQIRRCSVSIASNIAEGSQRSTKKDFLYFLSISIGSTAELETQLCIAWKLGYIRNEKIFDQCKTQITEIRRMISGLRLRLPATYS